MAMFTFPVEIDIDLDLKRGIDMQRVCAIIEDAITNGWDEAAAGSNIEATPTRVVCLSAETRNRK